MKQLMKCRWQNATIKLFLLIGLFAFLPANGQVITGVVSNQNDGQPLAGVTVLLKGTSTSTVTDVQGKYTITIDDNHRVLVYSSVGFSNKEVNVKGRTVINVSLAPEIIVLEDEMELEYELVMEDVAAPEYSTRSRADKSKRMQSEALFCIVAPPTAVNMEYNTEGYSTIHENGFKKTSLNPLSTFSIDVDAASYSNVRRFINGGSLPPVDAVRIEEMINYFNYDYKQPKSGEPFSINTELSYCPWNKENLLLHVGLQGVKLDLSEMPPSNIVFLLDVSGSMSSPQKLPLLKSSLKLLVNQLRPNDRVAIVVYAGSSGLVLPSTPGNNKQAIIEALERLNAGGSTAGGAGLKLAYKVATDNFIEEGNNRIILATDGDFNVGESSNAAMERLIETEREKGIAISVLGFGMGNYKDDKMEIIADKGNGNYAYIDNLQEAKKVLVSEFGGTLFTIAKDVKFQLEFNPAKVESYRLIGYENRLLNEEDFDDDKKDAGEMGAGHTVTALYEIVPAKNNNGKTELKYQGSKLTDDALNSNDLVTLKLRYKDPDGYKSKLLVQEVKNTPVSIGKTSNNLRYSAAIAQFGMLLRNSEFVGTATWQSTEALAQNSKGSDADGYRAEMIRLIQAASVLQSGSAQRTIDD